MSDIDWVAENSIVSAIGAFEESLEFEWGSQTGRYRLTAPQTSDPIIAANSIDALAADLNDMAMPLEASREVIVRDVELRFQHEQAPDGSPWAEWAESYRPVAERRNIGKLRREGTEKLYEAATDRSAYRVDGNDMFIDTSGFPDYWAIHQYGGVVSSPGMKRTRAKERRAAKREERDPKSVGAIPARPFLGLSYDAQAAVGDIFDAWLSGEITEFQVNPLRGPGALQPRLRSGRFGKMKFA